MKIHDKLTTASGCPIADNQNSQTIGPRGPILLQDYFLHEKMAHFSRERIPERVVNAKGSGAYGTFTVTGEISKYSRAKIFDCIGKQTKVFVRFSTVAGEKGSSDTERDPRGFAIKFYTEDGNWDLVGNNMPVFFVKDPKKFPDFIHTQKRDPFTNMKSPTMMWDYLSLNPESVHSLLMLMSDRGTPYGYRHMNGYGCHTYSMINEGNDRTYVKFHFKTKQGIKNFNDFEASQMKGLDPEFSHRDLMDNIETGNFPEWRLMIQVMSESEARIYSINPFDVSKVWPHGNFPLIEVGTLELNQNPENYFQDVEQSAFAPAHVVDGISYSPDKMLQGRLLAYPDAQRYRLGTNYEQIQVNRCPFAVNNHQRDGHMRMDGNGGRSKNYYPSSSDSHEVSAAYAEPSWDINARIGDYYDGNADGDSDHYSQAGDLFDIMPEQERNNTIDNIINAMLGIDGPKRAEIINRQLCHWFRVRTDLGIGVARGLGLQTGEEVLPSTNYAFVESML